MMGMTQKRRVREAAGVTLLIDYDKVAKIDSRWASLEWPGTIVQGKEIGKRRQERDDVFWVGTSGTPIQLGLKPRSFRSLVSQELTARGLEDPVATARKKRSQMALKAAGIGLGIAAMLIPGIGPLATSAMLAASAALADGKLTLGEAEGILGAALDEEAATEMGLDDETVDDSPKAQAMLLIGGLAVEFGSAVIVDEIVKIGLDKPSATSIVGQCMSYLRAQQAEQVYKSASASVKTVSAKFSKRGSK